MANQAPQVAPEAEVKDKNAPEEYTYQIIPRDDGFIVDVYIDGKNAKKIREKLRNAGGDWNNLRHSYAFLAADMKKVYPLLGIEGDAGIIDPSKTLVADFSIKFQCNDRVGAEAALEKIGMKKDRSGVWKGGLEHVDVFRQAFSN